MNIFYAVIILLCIIAFTCGLWVGGICIFSTFGYCFAGFIMLCYYMYFAHKKIKVFFGNVLKWIRRLYTIMHWLSAHKNVIYWSCFVLSVVGGLLALYFFTDIFAIILQKQYETKDYAGVVVSVTIGTIVSILAIASPMLINAIHKFSNRYQNNAIVTLFLKRKELKVFKYSLYASIGLSACWLCCHYIFDNSSIWYNLIVLLLYLTTAILVICLLVLIWKIVAFMTPSELVKIVIDYANNLKVPSYYFDSEVYKPLQYGSKEENERLERLNIINEYDIHSTQLYTVIINIWGLYNGDVDVHKNVIAFWKETCKKASRTIGNIKHYTNCHYDFIYSSLDLANEHNKSRLQDESMEFLNTLLESHLPVLRKYGEPEREIHKIQYELSYDTIEFMWHSMVKCINGSNDEIFQKYWQRASNFYSRKYHKHTEIPGECPIIDKINSAQSLYYAIHYLGCAYLIGINNFNLLNYALKYSQCMPFKWYLIPNNIEDALRTYIIVKDWYSDFNNRYRFSFTNDPNLFDRLNTGNPIGQFTCLLLFALWNGNAGNGLIELLTTWNKDRYLDGLIGLVLNTTKETDWVKYFQLEDSLAYKENIVKWLSQHKQD